MLFQDGFCLVLKVGLLQHPIEKSFVEEKIEESQGLTPLSTNVLETKIQIMEHLLVTSSSHRSQEINGLSHHACCKGCQFNVYSILLLWIIDSGEDRREKRAFCSKSEIERWTDFSVLQESGCLKNPLRDQRIGIKKPVNLQGLFESGNP